MNELVINRLDKYYGYARGIAGELGNDLLHEVLLKIPNEIHPKALDRYVFVSLRNEFIDKNSNFNKNFNPKKLEAVELTNFENENDYPDIFTLHKILLQIENDGFELEIKIFKECYLSSNTTKLASKTGIDHQTIRRILKHVKNEIRIRYNSDCIQL